jgi:ABC-type sugar transport system ATPase subunit
MSTRPDTVASGARSAGSTLRLEAVGKRFPDGTQAVRAVDLEVRDGEILVLVGPSGSGKSTVLRLVAGLETPSEGRVWIDGEDVTSVEPRHRDVAMVFQSYALYPHRTVRQNLAFGLRMRGLPPGEIRERVEWAATTLDLAPLLEKRPGLLSGGQRQRVALGRAIVRRPKLFLLDEPLSNLDPALRQHTRTELAQLQRRLGTTTLYVTHDQEEAMTLGHRVAVFREGRVEQLAPPLELYRRPRTTFVASFVGSPAMNLVHCTVTRGADGPVLAGGGIRLSLGGREAMALGDREEVVVGIRPHDVRLVDPGEAHHLTADVLLVEPRGSEVVVRLGPRPPEGPTPAPPASFGLVLAPESGVREGDTLAVRLPAERLHLFDVETGGRLDSTSPSPDPGPEDPT